jgi:hypothetical protein
MYWSMLNVNNNNNNNDDDDDDDDDKQISKGTLISKIEE